MVGLIGKTWFVEQLLLQVVEQLPLLVVEQHSNPILLSNETSPVFSLTTFGCNKLGVFLEDNCIRSSLTECQSFLNRNIDVDPKYRVLMPFPCAMQVSRETW